MERIIRFLIQEIGSIEGCELIKNKVGPCWAEGTEFACGTGRFDSQQPSFIVQVDEFLQTDDSYVLEAVEGELQSLYQNFLRFKDSGSNSR